MQQITERDLRSILAFEIRRAGKSVYRDLGSPHQGTRNAAVNRIVDAYIERMRDWEILTPEPVRNIFADPTPGGRG